MGDKNPRKKMKAAQPRAKTAPETPAPMTVVKKGLAPQPKKGGRG